MHFGSAAGLFSILALYPSTTLALTLDCKQKTPVDGATFDIQPLAGPRSVRRIHKTAAGATENTTFTFDLCNALPRDSDIDKNLQCSTGARVCASKSIYTGEPKEDQPPEDVWNIAGQFATTSGRTLEPHLRRLKSSHSNNDQGLEGLRIELHGGNHERIKQKAIIELHCDKEHTGLENDKKGESGFRRLADEDNGDNDDTGNGKDEPQPDRPLQFVSYEPEPGNEIIDVLRISWKTKYACEGEAEKEKPDQEKSHWGFFTWFIIIFFLAVAAYLVFGSWLNYNRYGARGWDLLPHGDTIRDIPYILKDWGRRVLSTVQGSSNRGGYSAI